MGKETAEARVVLIIGLDDAGTVCDGGWVESVVFLLLTVAGACAVHDFPCIAVDEGEFIGCDADDVAVLVVEGFQSLRVSAAYCVAHVGDSCCGHGFRARVVCQWVEVDIVDYEEEVVGWDLLSGRRILVTEAQVDIFEKIERLDHHTINFMSTSKT